MYESLHASLPAMKSILASLFSLFLAATFSDSASCIHVSAAEINTPGSAITVDGISIRAEQPDSTVDISPPIHKANNTNPNDTYGWTIGEYDHGNKTWPWEGEDKGKDKDGIECGTISGRGKSMEVIVGECRIFIANGDPGEPGCEAALDEDDPGWVTPEEGSRCIDLYQIEPANWTGTFYVDCPK